MTSRYQVNLNISAGMDFFQEFSLTNADFSPMDLTGLSFHGTIQKHSKAIDVTSSSKKRVYAKFETEIIDASRGIYSIKLPSSKSQNLEEGKYVYDVTISDASGKLSPANSGLIFVDNGLGVVFDSEIIDGGTPDQEIDTDELIIDGGTPTTFGSGPDVDGGYPLGYI